MGFSRKWSNLLFVSLLSLTLLSCGSDDSDPPPPSHPEFGHFHWSSFPVQLRVERSILSREGHFRDLRAAMAFWERRAGKKLFAISGDWDGPDLPYSGSADAPDSISTNALIFGNNEKLENSIAGITSLRVNGETIQGAVILLDPDAVYCFGLCLGEEEQLSLRRLLAHELGHFLGLGHSSDPENIMYPKILPGGSLYDRTVDKETLLRLTRE